MTYIIQRSETDGTDTMDILKALFTGKGAIRRRLVDLAATILLFAIFYIVTFILLGI